MKKKLSALEELRKKMREEEASTKNLGFVAPIPTVEESKLFIDRTIFQAFEQIKREIAPCFEKIRIRKYKWVVGFNVREIYSNYYYNVLLDRQKRIVLFTSKYNFPSKFNNSLRTFSIVPLLNEQRQFQHLSEITGEHIIESFNRSFFSRLAEMEKSIKKSNEGRWYDDAGEIENPHKF